MKMYMKILFYISSFLYSSSDFNVTSTGSLFYLPLDETRSLAMASWFSGISSSSMFYTLYYNCFFNCLSSLINCKVTEYLIYASTLEYFVCIIYWVAIIEKEHKIVIDLKGKERMTQEREYCIQWNRNNGTYQTMLFPRKKSSIVLGMLKGIQQILVVYL